MQNVGIPGEPKNEDQITIFSADGGTEETVGHLIENGEKEIVTDVLNRTLSIVNTVVSVLDDMKQSREEPFLCSTLQLNEETRSQTETEWKIFSSPETR